MQKETVEILPLSVAAAQTKQNATANIPSGIECIDNSIDGGFREGDFTIISGVPGNGKTTLARMFTTAFSAKGIPSIWFSYEMTIPELWDSFEKMGADASLISYVPIVMEHEYDWILEHIDKARTEFGVRAIFIDTIRDVVKPMKQGENYSLYVEQLCKDLRDYAIANKMMIFAIAHATKSTRSNTEETSNSDIAYSNGIPATATNIFHVWRSKKRKEEDITYVKIGKSRRDGTKKDWKYQFKFIENKLLPVTNERYEDLESEFE